MEKTFQELTIQDDFLNTVQTKIREIKSDREMGAKYMLLELKLREQRREGRIEMAQENVLDPLEELGEVPESLRERILSQKDETKLKLWCRQAARVSSFEEFEELIRKTNL